MAAEARELRPGGEEVVTRLGDILVIQAIRSWIETDPAARAGWLGALQDRQIGPAISLIHREPAREWTVASLARELAMSRSALAARFTELVVEPVMQYVTRWLMHLALSALGEEDVTVAELASRLGIAEDGYRLVQQQAQLRDRHRLYVVLSGVHIDELCERQAA